MACRPLERGDTAGRVRSCPALPGPQSSELKLLRNEYYQRTKEIPTSFWKRLSVAGLTFGLVIEPIVSTAKGMNNSDEIVEAAWVMANSRQDTYLFNFGSGQVQDIGGLRNSCALTLNRCMEPDAAVRSRTELSQHPPAQVCRKQEDQGSETECTGQSRSGRKCMHDRTQERNSDRTTDLTS